MVPQMAAKPCYDNCVFDRPATAWPDPTRLVFCANRQKQKETLMKNIFVGNLDFAATESSIRALFEPYGNVERVNLVTDRDTGRSRGFAFVEMTDSAEADRAIAALNGTELDGRALNINEARPKPAGGGNRGFGGGGGGRPRSGGGGGGPRRRSEPRW
jgi:RNA recognition motif-containing protein